MALDLGTNRKALSLVWEPTFHNYEDSHKNLGHCESTRVQVVRRTKMMIWM